MSKHTGKRVREEERNEAFTKQLEANKTALRRILGATTCYVNGKTSFIKREVKLVKKQGQFTFRCKKSNSLKVKE